MTQSTTHSVPWHDDPDHIDDHHVSDDELEALMKAFERMRQAKRQRPVLAPKPPVSGGIDNG